jgi:hypothetical protein
MSHQNDRILDNISYIIDAFKATNNQSNGATSLRVLSDVVGAFASAAAEDEVIPGSRFAYPGSISTSTNQLQCNFDSSGGGDTLLVNKQSNGLTDLSVLSDVAEDEVNPGPRSAYPGSITMPTNHTQSDVCSSVDEDILLSPVSLKRQRKKLHPTDCSYGKLPFRCW